MRKRRAGGLGAVVGAGSGGGWRKVPPATGRGEQHPKGAGLTKGAGSSVRGVTSALDGRSYLWASPQGRVLGGVARREGGA